MQRIVIFGNSGSGKSTLAKDVAAKHTLSHLDLDVLAWQKTVPPKRKTIEESQLEIDLFLNNNHNWVIEGCYSDLLSLVIQKATEIIFLNPGVETCVDNCRNRPWEPHKYKTMEEQNNNLDLLINWVEQYPERNDEFSLSSHQKLFDAFTGTKTEYNSNNRAI